MNSNVRTLPQTDAVDSETTGESIDVTSDSLSYYCDICESLRDIETGNPDGTNPASPSMSSFASQLRGNCSFGGHLNFIGLQCPQRPGYYTFRKEFCFNDWAAFDADGDCQLDFLQNEKSDLKSALASLQQIGYVGHSV